MYCKKCGTELLTNAKFCQKCGALVTEVEGQTQLPGNTPSQPVLEQKPIVQQAPQVVEEKPNNQLANVLCTISLVLYFGVPFLSSFLMIITTGLMETGTSSTTAASNYLTSIGSIISSVSTLAAYILMIIARVKCPKSTFAKIVMWIYIVLFAMGLITLVVILVTCAGILASCRG